MIEFRLPQGMEYCIVTAKKKPLEQPTKEGCTVIQIPNISAICYLGINVYEVKFIDGTPELAYYHSEGNPFMKLGPKHEPAKLNKDGEYIPARRVAGELDEGVMVRFIPDPKKQK